MPLQVEEGCRFGLILQNTLFQRGYTPGRAEPFRRLTRRIHRCCCSIVTSFSNIGLDIITATVTPVRPSPSSSADSEGEHIIISRLGKEDNSTPSLQSRYTSRFGGIGASDKNKCKTTLQHTSPPLSRTLSDLPSILSPTRPQMLRATLTSLRPSTVHI